MVLCGKETRLFKINDIVEAIVDNYYLTKGNRYVVLDVEVRQDLNGGKYTVLKVELLPKSSYTYSFIAYPSDFKLFDLASADVNILSLIHNGNRPTEASKTKKYSGNCTCTMDQIMRKGCDCGAVKKYSTDFS